ncbi:hemerythrin domain-containing protein [Polyangium aurulentum]|uniref:hemerythrin domain-containing protein n=1 Tax=Polyangium aurulentum TaxID=2567896 RepID=UPI0010AE4303|nr:hemerythrin domain-containing protein [Polyangium aurulentum]UQA60691.1 hemerythrin domain-containing protein [Polyangium aurulentum]
MDATEYLRGEHELLRWLFQAIRETPPEERNKRQALVDELSEQLVMHELLEEQVFYPALGHASDLVLHAMADHQHTRELLALVQSIEPACQRFSEQFEVLRRTTEEHLAEEERVLFAAARDLGRKEMLRLGELLEKRKRQLAESPEEKAVRHFNRTAWKVV